MASARLHAVGAVGGPRGRVGDVLTTPLGGAVVRDPHVHTQARERLSWSPRHVCLTERWRIKDSTGRATRMKGSVEKEHRIVKPTRLRPSHQAYRRPRSENPRPLRHCGLRLTLAARRRRSRRARRTLDMGWFGWASRPLLRPLLGARRTSWQATMGGRAYRDNRKAAGRASDGRHRASADEGRRIPPVGSGRGRG